MLLSLVPRSARRLALPIARRLSTAAWEQEVVPQGEQVSITIHAESSPVEIGRTKHAADAFRFQAPHPWSLTSQKLDSGDYAISLSETEPGGKLSASVREKWVSLNIFSKGGSAVSVEKLVEASLGIKSKGGNVKLGEVRAFDAAISTMGPSGCGSLEGVELSGAKLDVRTGRGALKLRRLVGKDVYVELHNAPMAVGALYAENTRVHTGGGSVELTQLDCSGDANIESEGGPILVHSLDGNANLSSQGAPVEVHLHSKVGAVRIASAGGKVRVAVSPEAKVEVAIRAAGRVACPPGALTTDERTQMRVVHFSPAPKSKGTRYGQLSQGTVVVDAANGDVEIVLEGWLDKVKARAQAKASQ